MLEELLNYTKVADLKVISVFREANRALPRAEYLFNHILNSHHIWVRRIRLEKPDFERFDPHPVREFEELLLQNCRESLEVLKEGNLSAEISYSNSGGETFSNVVSDILFHVVNHSTYHRAQVASEFRMNGLTPPVTDFIILKRQVEL